MYNLFFWAYNAEKECGLELVWTLKMSGGQMAFHRHLPFKAAFAWSIANKIDRLDVLMNNMVQVRSSVNRGILDFPLKYLIL